MVESEIISWVNNKLKDAGKTTSIRNFQDASISNARVVIDLIDSIKPGIINYDVVKDGGNEEVCQKIYYFFVVFSAFLK